MTDIFQEIWDADQSGNGRAFSNAFGKHGMGQAIDSPVEFLPGKAFFLVDHGNVVGVFSGVSPEQVSQVFYFRAMQHLFLLSPEQGL